MKFVLLSGIHSDGQQTYYPGDCVESTTDLSARFPEKFERWEPGDDDPNIPETEEE